MTIVGIERKTGEYKGYAYDNVSVYCEESMKESDDSSGIKTYSFKMKRALWLSCGCDVGDHVQVAYDRFGNVVTMIKE